MSAEDCNGHAHRIPRKSEALRREAPEVRHDHRRRTVGFPESRACPTKSGGTSFIGVAEELRMPMTAACRAIRASSKSICFCRGMRGARRTAGFCSNEALRAVAKPAARPIFHHRLPRWSGKATIQ
jgi:hypothetical protein